ncbi:hypothetical protein ACWD01_27115 [Streptomyces sp. NPDC002835]|jgi:hypothetical protein
MYEQSDAAAKGVLGASVLGPENVADEVMKGARGRAPPDPSHAEVRGHYAYRATDTDRWLRGMRRLRRRINKVAAG